MAHVNAIWAREAEARNRLDLRLSQWWLLSYDFWDIDIELYSPVKVTRRCGEKYRLHHQGRRALFSTCFMLVSYSAWLMDLQSTRLQLL